MWLCVHVSFLCHSRCISSSDSLRETERIQRNALHWLVSILVDSVTEKVVLPSFCFPNKMIVHQLIIQTAILEYRIREQHSFQTLSHAPMCQYIVLCAPILSLEIHRPYGNIMLYITLSVSNPLDPPIISGQLLVQMFKEEGSMNPRREYIRLEKKQNS